MDAYREYLDLFEYFGRGGMVKLGRAEFEALDAEWRALRDRLQELAPDERERFGVLKATLFRDRP